MKIKFVSPMALYKFLLTFGLQCLLVTLYAQNPDSMLFEAVYNGNVLDLKTQLQKGANINARDKNGFTPLLLAVAGKRDNLVKYLIRKGADIQTRVPPDKGILSAELNVLLLALDSKNTKLANYLIKTGADVNAQYCYGTSPLHLACKLPHGQKTVKYLLRYGANTELFTKFWQTPLFDACQNVNGYRISKMLIYNDAIINQSDVFLKTPLFYAISNKNGFKTVKLLLKKGAKINPCDLKEALEVQNHKKLTALLKKYGADFTKTDEEEIFKDDWDD